MQGCYGGFLSKLNVACRDRWREIFHGPTNGIMTPCFHTSRSEGVDRLLDT
jgi:hypothetical protein